MSDIKNLKISVSLDGETQNNFDTVKRHIEKATPGIRPTSADTLRYALYLAADTLLEVRKAEGSLEVGRDGEYSTMEEIVNEQ